MVDEIKGNWFGVDPEWQRQHRKKEIERITSEIARLKADKLNDSRLLDLERDLAMIETIEKFDAGNSDCE